MHLLVLRKLTMFVSKYKLVDCYQEKYMCQYTKNIPNLMLIGRVRLLLCN